MQPAEMPIYTVVKILQKYHISADCYQLQYMLKKTGIKIMIV